jgi:hypothetical protein
MGEVGHELLASDLERDLIQRATSRAIKEIRSLTMFSGSRFPNRERKKR